MKYIMMILLVLWVAWSYVNLGHLLVRENLGLTLLSIASVVTVVIAIERAIINE